MSYGDPPRCCRLAPPPFSGVYLAEDDTHGWRVVTYDANHNRWRCQRLITFPAVWVDLPPRSPTLED